MGPNKDGASITFSSPFSPSIDQQLTT